MDFPVVDDHAVPGDPRSSPSEYFETTELRKDSPSLSMTLPVASVTGRERGPARLSVVLVGSLEKGVYIEETVEVRGS